MTATVAAYDLERAAPQPSTAVASAPPPQNSDAGPRATMAAGQAAKDIGEEMDRYGLHLDTLQAQDALNQLRAKKEDLAYGKDGFMQVKGGAVIDPNRPGGPLMDDYKGRLQAATDDISGKLSPRARTMFNPHASAEMTGYKSDIAKHSIQQTEVYNKSVFNTGNAQDLTDVVRYAQDPAMVTQIADRAKGRAEKFAITEGLDPGFFGISAQSNVVRAAIESRASQNDGPGALALFRQFGDKLDGKDKIEVSRTINTVQIGQNALSYVGGLSGGGSGPGYDNNIGNISATNISYPGKGAPAGKFETFQSPEHGVSAAYGTIVAKAKQNGGAITFADLIGGNTDRGGKVQGWAPTPQTDADKANPMLKGNNAEAYAARLAQSVGLKPGDQVPLGDDAKMEKILREMNLTEKGRQTVSDEMYGRGIKLAKGDQTIAPTMAADVQPPADPLTASVNQATGTAPAAPAKAEGPPGFLDTRTMTIDAEKRHIAWTADNQARFANNPPQMAANQHLIDVAFESEKGRITLAQHQLNKAVEDWVSSKNPDGTGQTQRPPPAIWNQLTYEKQRSIDATLAHNAKGTDAITDWETFYRLERMAGATPHDFANIDLMMFKPKLAKAEFEKLSGLQRTALSGDPTQGDLRDKHAIIKDSAIAAGLKVDGTRTASDAAAANNFYSWVEEAGKSWAAQNGRKPNGAEWQKIVDGVTMKIPSGSWMSGDKPIYELSASDIPEPVRQQYLDVFATRQAPPPSDHDLIAMGAATRIGVVPPSVVPVLASELKKRGRAVTPQNLLGAWNLMRSQVSGSVGAP